MLHSCPVVFSELSQDLLFMPLLITSVLLPLTHWPSCILFCSLPVSPHKSSALLSCFLTEFSQPRYCSILFHFEHLSQGCAKGSGVSSFSRTNWSTSSLKFCLVAAKWLFWSMSSVVLLLSGLKERWHDFWKEQLKYLFIQVTLDNGESERA